MKNQSIVSKVGLIAGFLFFAHALIPNSNAWPLMWPGLAGIFAIYSLQNKRSLKNFLEAAKSLLQMGLILAGIFFVFTLLALLILNIPETEKISSILGAEGPITINSSAIFGLLLASGLGMIIALVSGSISYPFFRKR